VLSIVDEALKVVPQIDILVNCAGIQKLHPVAEYPDDDWNEILQVNLSSCFQLSREVSKHMLAREPDQYGVRGKIINVTSLASFNGNSMMPAYAAAKGGLALLTKAFSTELSSKGIFVNGIAPGYIETDMTEGHRSNKEEYEYISSRIPCGRWGTPVDFEGPTVFLASNASNYVHGINLLVDGGYIAR
jgi:2-deoxy-D-gluconate 3-dehydrogenase